MSFESFIAVGIIIFKFITIAARRQVRAIYCRGNMIIRKFSKCSVNVKNQLFRSYVCCLYCCALWKDYSTSSFNMVRVAYNNVYRALIGIKRVYGHSISSEYVTIVLMVLKQLREN